MRRYQKKQLFNIASTLRTAVGLIENLWKDGKEDQIMYILEDCQQCAISMGEFVEKLEGEETVTVSLLEEFCEQLYELLIVFNNNQVNGEFFQEIQFKLDGIEQSIQTEFQEDKLQIVFLPYKASMWDSLESIWISAREDESCECYVVAIPYFDRNPDGSFGEMHEESNAFPQEVPMIWWKDIDLEKIHPDIIYIHNPYDDGNLVTSVHPAFYASRIKEFTELLVYVPYFISYDDVPEHFCVCAGTLYADRVIVESEKVRCTYIREFHKMEEEYHCKGKFGDPEVKFMALGSPKYDGIVKRRKEDFSLPEEWEQLIRKADGSKKKVILYNTSVSALLHENEKMLKKMREVFRIFRSNNNVVLWWRPHPLIMTTCKAMRQDLYIPYKNMVEEYRREGFGIYDDTVDLDRAIIVTDAYYGDWSSLVELYRVTGKPIMIQNLKVRSEA